MALADNLSLLPGFPTVGAGTPQSFVTTKRGPQDTERLNTLTTLSDPELFVIKHQVTGTTKNGGVVTDRHLVSLSRVERDSNGVAHTCVVNLTISVPRNGLFTESEVKRQLALLANFLFTTGNTEALLQNQS